HFWFPVAPNEKPRTRRGSSSQGRLAGSGRLDAHRALALGALHREVDLAVREREQRVVAAQAHVLARVELRAALAHDDVPGLDGLATIDLHAQVLRVRIAAVAGGTACLFVCHDVSPRSGSTGVDAGDLDFGVVLPMPHLLAKV